MLIATVGLKHLFAFLIFSGVLGLLAWGVFRLVKVEAIKVVLWVIFGIFWLMMIWDLFNGGKNMTGLLP
jgi:hypothetical protein